ncbi:UPF0183-domain-containing protein [Schizophyllum commune Tattone D]|nr:UPF0183-domain-containing protein [Schizophyllum commune Tattone D]
MLGVLDLDVRPSEGLGMFEIGSSLWTVLDVLRGLQHIFPQVDVKYDPESTTGLTPVVLHLRPHIDLLFSAKHQRLHTICVRRLRDSAPPLVLRYRDKVLSGKDDLLRRVDVSRTFGPTYQGEDLRYPGLWFSFEDDGVGEALGKGKATEDRKQEVKRIFISQTLDDGQPRDALDEVLECPAMFGDVARAVARVHEGVTLYFYPSDKRPIHVCLRETTAQDLVVDLGPPLRTHYKEDDRMRIHSSKKTPEEDEEPSYFYNYFRYGIDFLISGKTHVVEKIVLHTNIPGSPLFQRYKRCNWEIEGTPEDDEDDTPPRKRFYERFETISHFLSPREPPPSMLLDRTDDEDGVTLPSSASHSGDQVYGYDGIVLEVSEASQVLSVMLF